MTTPVIRYVHCMSPAGLHRLAYKEWGDASNPHVLVCVHGLTRVSDDFDAIAAVLCEHYRVICPDIVGRGRSDHLRDPAHYQVPQYIADMVTLIARLDIEQVDWLGTSMGGLIGIGLAAQPQGLIRRLVLNDIGPELDPQAMTRIADYVGQAPAFATFEQARDYVKLVSASFGEHDEAQWSKLARDVLIEEQGKWHLAYDPALALPFKAMTPESIAQAEQTLWAAYDAIRCPTLLLRGEASDMLTSDTAQQMTQRGPKAQLQVLQNVGHAPTLLGNAQIALVKDFLLA